MFDRFIDVAGLMQKAKSGNICDNINVVEHKKSQSFFETELDWRQDSLLKYRDTISEKQDIGIRVPILSDKHRIIRKIARILIKIVNKLSQVITKDQRIVNNNMLLSIDRLRESSLLLHQEINDMRLTAHQTCQNEINQVCKKMEYLSELIEGLQRANEKISMENENNKNLIISNHNECCNLVYTRSNENKRIIQRVKGTINQLLMDKSQINCGKEAIENDHNSYMSLNNKDLYYEAFEQQFRGSEEEIKSRLRSYIKYIDNFPVSKCLDLGCGRGEWLELLNDNGYEAIGIDLNESFLKKCKNKNLNVKHADVLTYLMECKDNSFDLISGFHIIEHIDDDKLNEIILQCYRVLTQGGLLIFETPNPKNLIVGSCNFYMDSTHIRPVLPERMKFKLEYYGFYDIEYIYWQQQNIDYIKSVNNVLDSLDMDIVIKNELKKTTQYFNCPEDYGIIGRKA